MNFREALQKGEKSVAGFRRLIEEHRVAGDDVDRERYFTLYFARLRSNDTPEVLLDTQCVALDRVWPPSILANAVQYDYEPQSNRAAASGDNMRVMFRASLRQLLEFFPALRPLARSGSCLYVFDDYLIDNFGMSDEIYEKIPSYTEDQKDSGDLLETLQDMIGVAGGLIATVGDELKQQVPGTQIHFELENAFARANETGLWLAAALSTAARARQANELAQRPIDALKRMFGDEHVRVLSPVELADDVDEDQQS